MCLAGAALDISSGRDKCCRSPQSRARGKSTTQQVVVRVGSRGEIEIDGYGGKLDKLGEKDSALLNVGSGANFGSDPHHQL